MKVEKRLACAAFALLLAAVPAAQARAADEDGSWKWVAAPYLWCSSISTNLKVDVPPVGSETTFSDLIKKLDMAAQVHVEGQGPRFGAFGDLTYIALSDESERTGFDSKMSVDTTMLELAGVWNVDPARFEGLDVIAGLRHVVADTTVTFDPTAPAAPNVEVGFDQSYTDFMLGLRYTARLSDRWRLITRVDGAWGDTDGSFNGNVMLGYKTSERGSLMFGYRYMNLNLNAGPTDLDVRMSGPVFSYAFGLN